MPTALHRYRTVAASCRLANEPLGAAQPGTRDFFLLERYVLYTRIGDALWRARIHHRPWPLRGASLDRLESTMLEATGLATPSMDPLVHAQAEAFDVAIWRPHRVGRRSAKSV